MAVTDYVPGSHE